ncbi:MAG: riboflavin synthase, partial [Blastocatellia bacterium]|nr:riboflavin synthase [Blastocatellia bacterium]
MFTGIVEEVGKLLYISSSPQGGQLTVEASLVLDDLKIGDSVAINGVCLTVVKINHRTVVFDTSAETLERTTLGKLRTG